MSVFRSTAPRHVMRRYLGGRCDVLATALAKSTGHPLWGMKNDAGQIEHVFVRDANSGLAIDIRGAMPLEEVARGSALEHRSHEFVETDLDEVTTTYGIAGPSELREAREVVKDHLSRVIEKVSELPSDHPAEP